MKKIFLITVFLIGFLGFSQGGPKVDAIKFRGKLTTTIRDLIDVPTGQTWLIHNVTTNQFEWANDDDVWNTLAVSGEPSNGDKGDIVVTLNGLDWRLDSNSVDTDEIVNGAVRAQDIQNAAIDLELLADTNSPSSGDVLGWSGSGSTFTWVANGSPDLSANYTWTGDHIFQNPTYFESSVTRIRRPGFATASYQLENSTGVGSFGLDGTSLVIDVDASFNNVQVRDNTASPIASFDRTSKNTTFYGDIIKDGATSDDVLLGDGTTTSLSGLGASGDISEHPDSGQTGIRLGLGNETQTNAANINATDIYICSDCPPMDVQTSTTIKVDGYRGIDDRAVDSGTFTFSNLKAGAVVEIEIDRATDATYSGITFVEHPDSDSFQANTRQLVWIKILPSGDALRLYSSLE